VELKGLSGKKYELGTHPFRNGGEGDIYNVINAANSLAKIYHADRITKELENKLKIMVRRPPSSDVLNQVAWPLDVIYYGNNQFCGFIMRKLNIAEELLELYKYPPQKYKNFTTRNKIRIAENICAVISEVHKAGYVFGDFNPRNIGVNLKDGIVAFLDTDSYHIYDEYTDFTYRCKVCLDGYVAPELLKACENYSTDAYAIAPLPTFTKETDNFALAIHIFKLLMNGYTPYNGIKESDSVSVGSPGVGNNAIKQNNYCFKPGNKPQAVAVPRLDVLPKEITDLFTRAFMDGGKNPKQRPAAIEWHGALDRYENSLKTCSRNSVHQYKSSLASCPWCEADERYVNSITPPIAQKPFGTPVVSVPPQYVPRVVPPPPPPPPIQKRNNSFWGGIILGFMLLFMICYAVLGTISSGEYKLPPVTESTSFSITQTIPSKFQPSPLPLVVGSSQVFERDGMKLMFVPAGEFQMGSKNNGNSNEKPVHTVNLDAYWIDQTDVTNAMYARCVSAGSCKPPQCSPSGFTGDHQPVVCVNWSQADAYCKWAGRSLPTEAQWEKAARSADGRTYPWGNQAPDNSLLNYNSNVGKTTDVGRYPGGASPYGALDMAGNVWEWVADWYTSSYYSNSPQSNPTGPDSGSSRVLRGGSWSSYASESAFRSSNDPTSQVDNIGFRCSVGAAP